MAIGYRTFDAFVLKEPRRQLRTVSSRLLMFHFMSIIVAVPHSSRPLASLAVFLRPLLASTSTKVIWFTTDWRQAIYSFPIISVAFLCHFNVLPLHEEFFRPTRKRLRAVVTTTMSITSGFYSVLGVLGYVYAYNGDSDPRKHCGPAECHGIAGDILNNFDKSDPLINAGRVGLAVTLLSSFPLLVLPCRNSLQRLLFLLNAQLSTCKKRCGCEKMAPGGPCHPKLGPHGGQMGVRSGVRGWR